jgi:hypothetical protein
LLSFLNIRTTGVTTVEPSKLSISDPSKPNQFQLIIPFVGTAPLTILELEPTKYYFAYTCVPNTDFEAIYIFSRAKTLDKPSFNQVKSSLARFTNFKAKDILPVLQDC